MEQKLNMNVNVQGNEAVIRMGKATDPFNYPGTTYKALSTDSFVDIVEARNHEYNLLMESMDVDMLLVNASLF